jgi:hypothetical protein
LQKIKQHGSRRKSIFKFRLRTLDLVTLNCVKRQIIKLALLLQLTNMATAQYFGSCTQQCNSIDMSFAIGKNKKKSTPLLKH